MNDTTIRFIRSALLLVALALTTQACETGGYEHVFDTAKAGDATPARDAAPGK